LLLIADAPGPIGAFETTSPAAYHGNIGLLEPQVNR
jgi:hypothetical protein